MIRFAETAESKHQSRQNGIFDLEGSMKSGVWRTPSQCRRTFISGTDARIIMGNDEDALLRLWRHKRGETEPDNVSNDFTIQMSLVTRGLNRQWFERRTGRPVTAVGRHVKHPAIPWISATLDGFVHALGSVFSAKFTPLSPFSAEVAAGPYMAELQHNMWVIQATNATLAVITGEGHWIEIRIPADPLYQTILIAAEKKFMRCVRDEISPHLYGATLPQVPIEVICNIDPHSLSKEPAHLSFSH